MKIKAILRVAVIIGAVITVAYTLINWLPASNTEDADKTPPARFTPSSRPSAAPEKEDGNESSTGYDYIDQGLADLGDSFVTVGSDLQVTVNSISLFTNVFTAGWELEDFDKYTMVITNAENYSDSRLLDCIDPGTGALDVGLTMVVADITVMNLNAESKVVGPAADIWGNNVMVLVKPVVYDENTDSLPACEPVACSCEKPIEGQRTWVYIAPGKAVSYRLAFIADDYVRLENGYLTEDPRPSEGQIYFPLTLAE